MSLAVRLWEKIMGVPHEHRDSMMVSSATRKLIQTNEDFLKRIRPYADAKNPLEALLSDALNQRLSRGNNNGPKHHT